MERENYFERTIIAGILYTIKSSLFQEPDQHLTRAGHVPTFSRHFVNGYFQPLKKEKLQVAFSFKGKNQKVIVYRL